MTSTRGKVILANRHTIEDDTIPNFSKEVYNSVDNTKGAISLCSAQNMLCEDILSARIKEHLLSSFDRDWMYYPPEPWGTIRLRQTICDILNTHFNPRKTILPDKIVIGTGTTAIISMVCSTIMDPGDYMLCLTPNYFRIPQDIGDEAGVNCYNVPMVERKHFANSGSYGAEQIEKYFLKAVSEGHTVKGLFLINPHNPTGKLYSESELLAILKVCKKYNLHVIADEIYGLTIHSEAAFTSVISIKELPDSERTHFIWGLSKDFCMNGFRCGMVHTENESVLDALKSLSHFHSVPVPVQKIISNVLSDRDWIQNVFLLTNKHRYRKAHKEATSALHKLGIPFYKGSAGFCLWADFSEFLGEKNFQEEFVLFEEMAKNGLLIYPGSRFSSTTPGLFRITFTVPSDQLTEGLSRIQRVCEKRRSKCKLQA